MAIYTCENPPPAGRYGPLRIYKSKGRTIACMANPLSGERVKHAPEFANTRKHAELLAIASPLAAAAYSTLPDGRKRTHYQQLAGKAIHWLKADKNVAEVQILLQRAAAAIAKTFEEQQIPRLIASEKAGGNLLFSLPAQRSIGSRKHRTGANRRTRKAAASLEGPGFVKREKILIKYIALIIFFGNISSALCFPNKSALTPCVVTSSNLFPGLPAIS